MAAHQSTFFDFTLMPDGCVLQTSAPPRAPDLGHEARGAAATQTPAGLNSDGMKETGSVAAAAAEQPCPICQFTGAPCDCPPACVRCRAPPRAPCMERVSGGEQPLAKPHGSRMVAITQNRTRRRNPKT